MVVEEEKGKSPLGDVLLSFFQEATLALHRVDYYGDYETLCCDNDDYCKVLNSTKKKMTKEDKNEGNEDCLSKSFVRMAEFANYILQIQQDCLHQVVMNYNNHNHTHDNINININNIISVEQVQIVLESINNNNMTAKDSNDATYDASMLPLQKPLEDMTSAARMALARLVLQQQEDVEAGRIEAIMNKTRKGRTKMLVSKTMIMEFCGLLQAAVLLDEVKTFLALTKAPLSLYQFHHTNQQQHANEEEEHYSKKVIAPTTTSTLDLTFPQQRMEYIQQLFWNALLLQKNKQCYNSDTSCHDDHNNGAVTEQESSQQEQQEETIQLLLEESDTSKATLLERIIISCNQQQQPHDYNYHADDTLVDDNMRTMLQDTMIQMRIIVTNATLHVQQAQLNDFEEGGVTRVISVRYSEHDVLPSNTHHDHHHDSSTAHMASMSSSLLSQPPTLQSMDSEQESNLQLARQAAQLEQSLLAQLLQMDTEERNEVLRKAEAAQEELMQYLSKQQQNETSHHHDHHAERIHYMTTQISPETQKLLILHKIWQGLLQRNNGQPPRLYFTSS